MAPSMDEQKATLRENVLFYVTAFFCLVAIFSLFIFLFLVPFFIEPALATIYMEFDPQPVICETTEATFHRGLSNCQWSSCREGCTKEVYECWHIRVRYRSSVPVGKADARSVRDRIIQDKESSKHSTPAVFSDDGFDMSPQSNEDRLQSVLPEEDEVEKDEAYALADEGGEGLHVHEARLQPNVKGCGYPPEVECNNTFASAYGVVGANFSCYYSLIDPTLAITHLNIERVRAELIYCLTIPIILFVISIVYLFYAYFKLYADPPASAFPKGTSSSNFIGKQLSFDGREVSGVVVSQPISSPLHAGGKYGLLYQFPSPDSTRIVRRAKSGGAITFASARSPMIEKRREVIVHSGPKTPTGSAHPVPNRGMRLSKSMGPRVGECSLTAAQRNPDDNMAHNSSANSSAPSSSSSSTSSLSSRSHSSSLSHLPASLSRDSSDNTNANLSIASISVEVLTNEDPLEYYSPTRSPRGNYVPTSQSTASGNPGRQRRKHRECIPLISNNH